MSKKRNKYAGDQYEEAYDPTGLSQYLGLGRPIDFDNGQYRLAMLCAILICVAVTLYKCSAGLESGDAVMVALGYALNFLFTFMLALELDPDRKLGGFIGGGLALAANLVLGDGNLLVSLWLLFILRMLNRSSGDRHRLMDNVIMIAIAAWLGREGFWVYPLLTGAAYIMESQIQAGYPRSLYLAGVALACLIFSRYGEVQNVLSLHYIAIMAVAFILYLPEIRCSMYVKAKGDKNGKRLLPRRLQIMAGFFMMVLFSITFLHGDAAAVSLIPAAAAAMGAGIYLFIALVRHEVV